MAEPLKHWFDRRVVERIADQILVAWPEFPANRFVPSASSDLDSLELFDRGRQVANVLRRYLPQDVPRALEVLERSLGPVLTRLLGAGMEPFLYLPHVLFVAEYGLDYFEESMRFQHALTQRFSAEWSIRPFLERYPQQTLARLRAFAEDPSPHVRRLASEGTRPRLPWASRLRVFEQDPRPVLALLELLRDDPSEDVRRSVANHLNDISKDNPALVLEIAANWLDPSSPVPPTRRALITHALRTLTRHGDRAALNVMGFTGGEAVEVKGYLNPLRAHIGGSVEIVVEVKNPTSVAQRAVVDLVVSFVRSDGGRHPEVFKGRTLELKPGLTELVRKRVSLANLTTRSHYPGTHLVEISVNGRKCPLGSFELLAAVR